MGFLGLFGGKRRKSERKEAAGEVTLPLYTAIESRVVAAFARVKQDITLLSSWVKYLKHKDLLAEQRHAKTQRELGEHKARIEGLNSEVAELKAAVSGFRNFREAQKGPETSSLTDLIRTKSELNPDRKRTYFENKVVTAIRSRRKDYVLKQIIELAAKETHSTREIEEIIVGEKAMCGRTAFYDYLRELKHKKMIGHGEKGSKKVIIAENAGLEQVR